MFAIFGCLWAVPFRLLNNGIDFKSRQVPVTVLQLTWLLKANFTCRIPDSKLCKAFRWWLRGSLFFLGFGNFIFHWIRWNKNYCNGSILLPCL